MFLHFRRHLIWEVILFCRNSLKHLRAQVSEQKKQIQHLDLGAFVDVPWCVHTFCLCTGCPFCWLCPAPPSISTLPDPSIPAQTLPLLGSLSWYLKIFVIWNPGALCICFPNGPFGFLTHKSIWHIVSAHKIFVEWSYLHVLSAFEGCRLLLRQS